MQNSEMMAQIVGGAGFFAALDQSGGSTPNALKKLGVEPSEYSSDEDMFALIHKVRSRIITAPAFDGRKVLGAILFEKTMDGKIDNKPVPHLLWQRGIVPFVKVDKGLQEEVDGVQLMKPNPDLDSLLDRATARGIFGTKMRSVINHVSTGGIAAVISQQFELANRILDRDFVPIIEPEVNVRSTTRAECDQSLVSELAIALDAQRHGRRVILKLSLPVTPDLYTPLIAHPNCVRVLALSGGFSQDEACAKLAANRGMIASFSRALLQDLRVQMPSADFAGVLGEAIDRIYRASTLKSLALKPRL